MFLGCSEDKHGIRRRLFKCLEERIEGPLREHVHLIDDIHRILTNLGRDAHLLDKRTDIIHGVVRRSIQLMDIIRALFVERSARLTFVARIMISRRVQAVDGLGEDTCAGGLTHSTRSAEEVSVSEMVGADCISEGLRKRTLPHHRLKRSGTILAG